MNLEKYAERHYRRHTVKRRESDILKGKKHRCDKPLLAKIPKKTLAVGLDGKGYNSARCSMSLRRG